MSFFDLDPTGTQNVLDQAQLNGVKAGDFMAPWYQGTGTGLWEGLKTAYNRDVYNAGNAQEKQQALENIQALKPDPHTVGMAGQLLHGLGDTLGTLALNFSGGNVTPTLLAASSAESYGKSQTAVHVAEGMDPTTAASVGKWEGIGVGLGVVAPAAVPGGWLTRMASGGAINFGLGGGQRALIGSTLRDAGYEDMARQYQVFDGVSMATDITIGALFGGLLGPRARAKEMPAVKPSDLDTTLTMNNAQHVELGTAPGIPADPAARAAHVEAVTKAIEDLVAGEPVRINEDVAGANFVPDPMATEVRSEILRVVDEHMGPEWSGLKAELEARGLPTDDIDQSGKVRVEGEPAPRPVQPAKTFEQFVAEYPKQQAAGPVQALRDFEAGQQEMLLNHIKRGGGITLETLRNFGLANSMKEAMQLGLGRLVKSEGKGGMSDDAMAEHLHQMGWTQEHDIEETRKLLAAVFGRKEGREPVVHLSKTEEHAQLQHDVAMESEFQDYTQNQARERARKHGVDENLAASNADAAHAFFDLHEGRLAAMGRESKPEGGAVFDKNATVEIAAIDPETGAVVKLQERAEVALNDNAERLTKMKGLLECLLG